MVMGFVGTFEHSVPGSKMIWGAKCSSVMYKNKNYFSGQYPFYRQSTLLAYQNLSILIRYLRVLAGA